jgi:carbamoylphosphate synthase large subunit
MTAFPMNAYGYVLAMVGHLKNVSPAFAQMPNRITNVEFTTVSPTIANTMLAVRCFFSLLMQ